MFSGQVSVWCFIIVSMLSHAVVNIHKLNNLVMYVCEYDQEHVHLLKIFTVCYINMWVHKDGSSDF